MIEERRSDGARPASLRATTAELEPDPSQDHRAEFSPEPGVESAPEPGVVPPVGGWAQAASRGAVLPGRHRHSGTGLTEQDSSRDLSLELGWLSDGSVASVRASGPVLAPRKGPRPRLRRSTFVAAVSRTDQAAIVVMSGV